MKKKEYKSTCFDPPPYEIAAQATNKANQRGEGRAPRRGRRGRGGRGSGRGRQSSLDVAGQQLGQAPQRGTARGQRGGRRGRGGRGSSRYVESAAEGLEHTTPSSSSFSTTFYPPQTSPQTSSGSYSSHPSQYVLSQDSAQLSSCFPQPPQLKERSHTSHPTQQHHAEHSPSAQVLHAEHPPSAQVPRANNVPQSMQLPRANQMYSAQMCQIPQPPQSSSGANSSPGSSLSNFSQQSPLSQPVQAAEGNERSLVKHISLPVTLPQQSQYRQPSQFYQTTTPSYTQVSESTQHSQSLHFQRTHLQQPSHFPQQGHFLHSPHFSQPARIPSSSQLPQLSPLSQTSQIPYHSQPRPPQHFSQTIPVSRSVHPPLSHLQSESHHNELLASLRMQQALQMHRNMYLNSSSQYQSVHSNESQHTPQSKQPTMYHTDPLSRASRLPTDRDFPSLSEYLQQMGPPPLHRGHHLRQSSTVPQPTSHSSLISPPQPPPLHLIRPQSVAQQMHERQIALSTHLQSQQRPVVPRPPNYHSDFSERLTTMAHHAATSFDTGIGSGFQSSANQTPSDPIHLQIAAQPHASSQGFPDINYATRSHPIRPRAHYPTEYGGQNIPASESSFSVGSFNSRQTNVAIVESDTNNERSIFRQRNLQLEGIEENDIASDVEDIETLERLKQSTGKGMEQLPKCLNEVQLAYKETCRNLEREGVLPTGIQDATLHSVPHFHTANHQTPVTSVSLMSALPAASDKSSESHIVSAQSLTTVPTCTSAYTLKEQPHSSAGYTKEAHSVPSHIASVTPETVKLPIMLNLKQNMLKTKGDSDGNGKIPPVVVTTSEVVTTAAVSGAATTSTNAAEISQKTVVAAVPVTGAFTATITRGDTVGSPETTSLTGSNNSSIHENKINGVSLIDNDINDVLPTELQARDIVETKNSLSPSVQASVDVRSLGMAPPALPVSLSRYQREKNPTLAPDCQKIVPQPLNLEMHAKVIESPLDLSVGNQRTREAHESHGLRIPLNGNEQNSDVTSSDDDSEELKSNRHGQCVPVLNIENNSSQLRSHLLSGNVSMTYPESLNVTSNPENRIYGTNIHESNNISRRYYCQASGQITSSQPSPSSPQIETSKCILCGKIAAYVCSLCGRAKYCSNYCQAAHWMTHKRNCLRH